MKQEELQYIAAQVTPVVLDALRANSQSVSEVPVISDIEGVVSLPGLKKIGGVEAMVEVPLTLLEAKITTTVVGNIDAVLDVINRKAV